MLKNSKVVLFVTLKSWSGRKLLDPTSTLLGLLAVNLFVLDVLCIFVM